MMLDKLKDQKAPPVVYTKKSYVYTVVVVYISSHTL